MSKDTDTHQVWAAIKRNPRLDNLVQFLFRSDQAAALCAEAEAEERRRDHGQ